MLREGFRAEPMFSVDTNILLCAVDEDNSEHEAARTFLESAGEQGDVALSEFALIELYVLLRNPAVLKSPLSAARAMETCSALRRHPHWQILGFPNHSRDFYDTLWSKLAEPGFARRRAYDWRMALSLLRQGVDEFATVNVKDFGGFGFKRVWNPLKEKA